jgi:hypothetical protein
MARPVVPPPRPLPRRVVARLARLTGALLVLALLFASAASVAADSQAPDSDRVSNGHPPSPSSERTGSEGHATVAPHADPPGGKAKPEPTSPPATSRTSPTSPPATSPTSPPATSVPMPAPRTRAPTPDVPTEPRAAAGAKATPPTVVDPPTVPLTSAPPPPPPATATPRAQAASGGGGSSPPPTATPTTLPTRTSIAPASPKSPFVPASDAAPLPPPPPTAVSSSSSAGGYHFELGFAVLKSLLGSLMGDPIEGEHGVTDGCDTQQATTTGLAYWSCSTGVLVFAASPDGLHHWAWLGDHLAEWIGPSAVPPAATNEAAAAPVCLQPGDRPSNACPIADGATVTGFILDSGSTTAYRFDVPAPDTDVVAQLSDLPADYDLYLADATNALIGQSVLEGTTPRSIEQVLPQGTYYLYVHSDPARDVDPYDPYTLHLALAPAVPATADATQSASATDGSAP